MTVHRAYRNLFQNMAGAVPPACATWPVTPLFQKSDVCLQKVVALGVWGVLYPAPRAEAALVVVAVRTVLGGDKPLTLLD